MVKNALFQNSHIHPLLYVIGDRPSKNNSSPYVPFVGTPSYKTLLEWMADMQVDVTRMRMYNKSDDPFNGFSGISLKQAVKMNHIKVIALGQQAMKYLMDVGLDSFFVLPHPSPANRASHKDIKAKLEQCKDYIYEGQASNKAKGPLQITFQQSDQEQEDVLPET